MLSFVVGFFCLSYNVDFVKLYPYEIDKKYVWYLEQVWIMKKFVYIFFACLAIQSANAIENEDYYNRQFCSEVSGQAEYRLPDRSRVDCLVKISMGSNSGGEQRIRCC